MFFIIKFFSSEEDSSIANKRDFFLKTYLYLYFSVKDNISSKFNTIIPESGIIQFLYFYFLLNGFILEIRLSLSIN